MTINEAIEILELEVRVGFDGTIFDLRDAIKLGIEALKAMAVIQQTHCPLAAYHKFGETEV